MDVLDMILRWVIHAAIFRTMWGLGPVAVGVLGVVALGVLIGRRVLWRRRRDG